MAEVPTSHSPTKTTQTPFQPYCPPWLSPFLPLIEVERLMWTRRALGADVWPVQPLGTCRAPAHLLLKSPFTPTNLPPPALPSLSPPSPPTPLTLLSPPRSPLCPLSRCGGAGKRQVDCRGAIPSPHGRRTLTVACRPPASVTPLLPPPPPSSNWPEWPAEQPPTLSG